MKPAFERFHRPLAGVRGFTLVELMIYMMVSALFVTAVFGVLLSQSRHLRSQVEVKDVRETLRGAAALLSTDLRHVSTERGDLYAVGAHSITVRSYSGGGVVCGVHATEPKLGLWRPRGSVGTDPTQDSVMVFDADSGWVSTGTADVLSGGGGLGSCAWSAAHIPDMVVQTSDTTLSVDVGTTLQSFRHVEYGMFEWRDRWWLGRKVSGASEFELLTGPLATPSQNGLAFRYFQASGAPTASPKKVARIEIAIRGESQQKRADRLMRPLAERYASDSVITTVLLRN